MSSQTSAIVMNTPDIHDKRVAAFCSPQTPELFASVAHANQIWEPDPCDVESIHSEARSRFEQLLNAATAPEHPGKHGRILLLKGESGAGKTHLMRVFRARAHQTRQAYFGYMQMTSSSSNYALYMLTKLIDSLDKPYLTGPNDRTAVSGLQRLSRALAELPGLAAEPLHRIREESLSPSALCDAAIDLAEQACRDPRLARVDLKLLQALLLLQSHDQAIHNRVRIYLRGEPLSELDERRLGGIATLDREMGPSQMLERLGHLIWVLHGNALVLCLDQLEDIFKLDECKDKFRRAFQSLISLTSHVPSAVGVISCLDINYLQLREFLDLPQIARIEQDPPPIQLESRRSPAEIEALVGRHLQSFYGKLDLPFDEKAPTFPLPPKMLANYAQCTARQVLNNCKEYREACIRAGQIVPLDGAPAQIPVPANSPPQKTSSKERSLFVEEKLLAETRGGSEGAAQPETSSEPAVVLAFEQEWNDALSRKKSRVPDEDADLAQLLCGAIELVSDELDTGHRFDAQAEDTHLKIACLGHATTPLFRLRAAICNANPQGGQLGKQYDRLTKAAQDAAQPAVPVAIRSVEYTPTKKKGSAIATSHKKVYELQGRHVVICDSDWRAILTMQEFLREFGQRPGFAEWRKETRPLASLLGIRGLLHWDRLRPLPPVASDALDPSAQASTSVPPKGPAKETSPAPLADVVNPTRASEPSKAPDISAPVQAEVGETMSQRASELIAMTADEFNRHVAFLGGTGSGKTTAALNIVEQLLLQGVPALFVDRKGDLASYARTDIWNQSFDKYPVEERPRLVERQQRLRERLDVALFTPGRNDGRPLTLSVVPDRTREMSSDEQELFAIQAAQGLGEMMGYRTSGGSASKFSVLVKAIELQVQDPDRLTLTKLIRFIKESDTDLVNAVGELDPKLFGKVVQDLQTLEINSRLLFPASGEPLDADALLGLGPHSRPGKTRLSIICTKFLGHQENVRFWVAQLLMELGRWVSRSPSPQLQAVVLLDEADQYLPATSKPVTKEPLENLLRRARSAGLGVFLATQSPGDFDYKARENLQTWFVGRIKEPNAIKKMEPLLSQFRLDIQSKLAHQPAGQFFFARTNQVQPLRSFRSVVDPEQLPEQDILRLAALQAAQIRDRG